jgi:hypothetical protein
MFSAAQTSKVALTWGVGVTVGWPWPPQADRINAAAVTASKVTTKDLIMYASANE